MRVLILCFLLLSACTDPDAEYDYALTWTCLSPESCERAEEVALINRLTIFGDGFFFESTYEPPFSEHAQKVASDTLPAGCSLLYGLSLFGYELEPSKLCSTGSGFELELSIPNRNPATHSEWLVEAREL